MLYDIFITLVKIQLEIDIYCFLHFAGDPALSVLDVIQCMISPVIGPHQPLLGLC